jgi:hypothetical protein
MIGPRTSLFAYIGGMLYLQYISFSYGCMIGYRKARDEVVQVQVQAQQQHQ